VVKLDVGGVLDGGTGTMILKVLETVVAGLADGEDAGALISFFRGSRARDGPCKQDSQAVRDEPFKIRLISFDFVSSLILMATL
jgi:hypothetical protein